MSDNERKSEFKMDTFTLRIGIKQQNQHKTRYLTKRIG